MIGAIAGDVIGSVYEFNNIRSTEFPLFNSHSRFTDDTVLTIAVADSLLGNGDFVTSLKKYGRKYPRAGYGGHFYKWLFSDDTNPYNSLGNGSAMRVSPVGFAFNTLEEVLSMARKSAEVTHNHPEGIKGAEAVAATIFFARRGDSKTAIREEISQRFCYNLERPLNEIRTSNFFNETCPGTVPEAIIAFLESSSFEDAIRLAISIGGDSDTIACITGSIAHAFYGSVPSNIVLEIRSRLPDEFLDVIDKFDEKFGFSNPLKELFKTRVL